MIHTHRFEPSLRPYSSLNPEKIWQKFGNRSYDCPELQGVAEEQHQSREQA